MAGIRITEDEVMEADEIDPAVVMAEDKLSCYICPMLVSYEVVVEDKLNRNVKELKELEVGQLVKVQNQAGNYGKRWARTGTVVEVGPGPRQYAVRMEGSRNVSLRNRKS